MVVKVRSGFDKLKFVTIIISKLEKILEKTEGKLEGKLKEDCESLRIALLSININEEFQVEGQDIRIEYQYFNETFDIVEKEDCLKGKFTDKQQYDLRRSYRDGKITIVNDELQLPEFEFDDYSPPEEIQEGDVIGLVADLDDGVDKETPEQANDDLLEYLKKAEKKMYTRTRFLSKKVKKPTIFKDYENKGNNLKKVIIGKPVDNILQDYSNAYYKREKIKESKGEFIKKLDSKYFKDELEKSYPKEGDDLKKVYEEMCTIIFFRK